MHFKRPGSFALSRNEPARRGTGRRRCRFEKLEDRRVLSTVPVADVFADESAFVASTAPDEVSATVETENISAADDAAIWIHPTDTALSRVIGTNKNSLNGLVTYDLAGNRTQVVASGATNNVDVRYGFPLAGQFVDIVAASNRSNDSIVIYKVDSTTGRLEHIAARSIDTGISVYGFGMYRSPSTGKFYGIVNSKSGKVEQWELFDDGNGKIDAALVREFDVGSQVEGVVADDELGHLYIGEERVGIWKYGAEPDSGTARTQVDATGSAGHLTADVEGLTIYYASDGTGYLIASSQGSDEFVIYQREGSNSYVGTFEVVAGNGIDAVSDTDGIDVTNVPLGPNFPQGVFVTQDNDVNFKLVPWQSVAQFFGPNLTIDTSWNPRGESNPPAANQPPTVSAGGDKTILVSESATLDGTATDDDLPNPPAQSNSDWSVISGPGTVSFANASAASTTASFSQPGTYLLQLTADDGQLSNSDTMTVTVNPPPGSTFTAVFQEGINGYQGTSDTYLRGRNPNATFGNRSTLKFDGAPDSSALIRWDVSSLPSGSQVTAATLRLNVVNRSEQIYQLYQLLRDWSEDDATWNQAANGLSWQASGAQGSQDRGSTSLATVSARATGTLTVALNASGLAVVQGWIDDPASNYGLIIQRYLSVSDGGKVSSHEARKPLDRPRLEITYSIDGGTEPNSKDNLPPTVSAGRDKTIAITESATLAGSVIDDGLPNPPAQTSFSWKVIRGPGNVSFANADAALTTARFSQTGTYVLQFTADDGQLSNSDSMTVRVQQKTRSRTARSGLVGNWQFETAGPLLPDASSSNNDGVVVGNPQTTTGRVGTAIILDGNDHAVVENDATLNPSSQITLSTWIRPDQSRTQYVIKKARANTADGYELSLSSSGRVFVRFNQASAGNSYRVDSNSKYPTSGNEWMHVSATYDGTTIRLYINGLLESSKVANFQIASNALDLHLGAGNEGYRDFSGAIDDARIYNRALTAAEVQQLASP